MSPYSTQLQNLEDMGILKSEVIDGVKFRYIPSESFELVLALYLHIIKNKNAVGKEAPRNVDFIDAANKFLINEGDKFFGYVKEIK